MERSLDRGGIVSGCLNWEGSLNDDIFGFGSCRAEVETGIRMDVGGMRMSLSCR